MPSLIPAKRRKDGIPAVFARRYQKDSNVVRSEEIRGVYVKMPRTLCKYIDMKKVVKFFSEE